MTLGEALSRASARIPGHEAERALEHALRVAGGGRVSRLDLYARAAEPCPPEVGRELERVVEGRAAGVPLQHLTRSQVFLEHEYECGPEALVPRPETEVLVSEAARALAAEKTGLGWELGLGTGVISVELLATLPGLRMRASELEAGAAELAGRNARRVLGQGASRLEILRAPGPLSGWETFGRPGDGGVERPGFLVSNPPYLDRARDEVHEEVLRHEPSSALFVGNGDPLHFYRLTAEQGLDILGPGGRVWLELAHERAGEVLELFAARGWRAELLRDLTGRERVLTARRE